MHTKLKINLLAAKIHDDDFIPCRDIEIFKFVIIFGIPGCVVVVIGCVVGAASVGAAVVKTFGVVSEENFVI